MARERSYATPEQLAQAVRTTATPTNTPYLQRCVDAASDEIDASLDRYEDDPLPEPTPDVIVSVAIARAVEWYKANDAAFGVVGYADTGALRAPKDSFGRHSWVIDPLWKQQFGLA
jgi:hypothetical protein